MSGLLLLLPQVQAIRVQTHACIKLSLELLLALKDGSGKLRGIEMDQELLLAVQTEL